MATFQEETLGIAMAGELTVFTLIGHLKAKGILSKDETVEIYERTLVALESYPKHEAALAVARQTLDQMATIAQRAPQGVPPPWRANS
jgi:hypothetical protein